MRRSVILCLLAVLGQAALAGPPERPNIVFILADDMGFGDAGCYNPGAKTATPNIDRLAAEGARFTDAHSAGALCVPSRYGLLTGRYPMRATLRPAKQACIVDGRLTLASLLKRNGYRTAMVGKWHLGFDADEGRTAWDAHTGGPCDRGFDSFFGIPASLDIPPYYYIRDRSAVAPPTDEIAASRSDGWSPIQGAFWRAGRIAPGFRHEEVLPRLERGAVSFIRGRGPRGDAPARGKAPFFLYVALPAPHTPWLPLPEYRETSEAGAYGDFVAQVDGTVGAILAAVDEEGLRDDTLVIFSSDNGPVWYDADEERFGHASAGGLRGMKADAWEGGHRVPFVARWPGRIPAGITPAETLCFTDMLATFASIVGDTLPADAGEDSHDMLPALRGEELDAPIREATIHKQQGTAIRQGRWKLITHLGSGGFSKPGRRAAKEGESGGQLYDLEADPAETTNLWADRPAVVARLTETLRRLRDEGRSTPVPEKPNFIVILADDMGYGDSGVYGGWLDTPNLARMAAEGMTFTDFHSSGTVCSPTRAGLVTGRYQQRAGIPDVINADPAHESHGGGLADEESTFAEFLRSHGYATAVFGKWHLGYAPEFNPIRHGFDRFRGFVSGNIDYISHYDRMQTYDWWDGMDAIQEPGYLTHLITRHAVRFIDEHADGPFCLYVPHGAVHSPIQAPDGPSVRGPAKDLAAAKARSKEDDIRAMMQALDESVGAVLDAVERNGIAERTFVIFLSDNGGAGHMRNDPLRGRKGTVFEGGHRVPAIAWWPGRIAPGARTDALCISLDVMPTMLDFAGVAAPPERPLDGVSLRSVLVHGDAPHRRLFWNGVAMRDGKWKLITGSKGGPLLFDLAADLAESENLASVHPERVARMRRSLRAWKDDVSR